MFNIAICDDNPIFLNKIGHLLQLTFSKYNHDVKLEMFTNGNELVDSLIKKKKEYDIIFLDIEMPVINGFRIAEKLRLIDNKFLLLFITHLDNEAPKGYRYEAFRFILKKHLTVDVEEAVRAIILRLKDTTLNNELIEFKCKHDNYYDFVNIKKGDIIFLEITNTQKSRRIILRTIREDYDLLVLPLKVYKKMLTDDNFIVVNRAYIVNLNHVYMIEGDYLQLTSDYSVFMGSSKTTKAAIKKQLMFYRLERVL